MNRIDFAGAVWFPVTRPQLWAAAEQFGQFQSWWGWLADFHADGPGLVEGNVLHGLVVPPVPYQLRLEVRLQSCEKPRLVEAAVDGDLRGQAVLRLEEAGAGTRAVLAWSLLPHSAPLRVAARVAYPLLRWGHDRVLDLAVSGFRQHALPPSASGCQPEHAVSRPSAAWGRTAGLSRPRPAAAPGGSGRPAATGR